MTSKILRSAQLARQEFDPKNKKHRNSFKKYLETGSWGEIQFFAEAPYVTVPETVFRKYCAWSLAKK